MRFRPPEKPLTYASYVADGPPANRVDQRMDRWQASGTGPSTSKSFGSTRGAEAWLEGYRPLEGSAPPGCGPKIDPLFQNLYINVDHEVRPQRKT